MKLHEIISTNEDLQKSILFEFCQPYLKSLKTYYEKQFNSKVIVMVTSITNTTCYVKFVSSDDFLESIYDFLGVNYIEEDQNNKDFNEDLFCEYETINANSYFL